MVAWLRERVQFHRNGGKGRLGDEAVSPVVGMILVLAISVVGISAILYWGLPAIDEMKANVEFRSVQSQFEEFDATVKELVAGTTEKTAKRWQPTLNRGNIAVYNNTEAWLFAVTTYAAGKGTELVWADIEDGDHSFTLYSKNASQKVQVEAYLVTGTSTSTTLNVTLVGGTTPWPQQMVGTTDILTWTAGSWKTFNVSQSASERRIENGTFRFDVYSDSTLIAQAFYVATGRVDFNLVAGLGEKSVIANNGAVFTGSNGAYTIVNTPPIPPPANTSGTSRTFARFISLGGDASFAGTDTFDVLVSLYSTATLANYDCAEADRSDCVRRVSYYNYGDYKDAWYSALRNPARGYEYELREPPATGNAIGYLEDTEGYMGFTLLQSSLKLVNG